VALGIGSAMVSDGSALFCRHLDHIDSSLTTIFLSRDQESNEIVVWEAVMFSLGFLGLHVLK
jgi:hypothetical protein